MKHTHRPIDLLIELAAERIGCQATWITPQDEMEARSVHVTTKTGGEQVAQIGVKADLGTILSVLLAAYETPESAS